MNWFSYANKILVHRLKTKYLSLVKFLSSAFDIEDTESNQEAMDKPI